MKKIIFLFIILLTLPFLVSSFTIETTDFAVTSTNTGTGGATLTTSTYAARSYSEPFYPSMPANSSNYSFLPGYFDHSLMLVDAYYVNLLNPGNGSFLKNDVTFSYEVLLSEFIYSCNLKVHRQGLLVLDQIDVAPLSYSFGPHSLSDGNYTWSIICMRALGNTIQSRTYSFVLDNTAPLANIIRPLDDSQPYTNFSFFVAENNPDKAIFNVNGTIYEYDYVAGTNTFSPGLPIGNYPYTLTLTDSSGNNATYGPYQMLVNDDPVSMELIRFDPSRPIAGQTQRAAISLSGTFSEVILSINTESLGWLNYTVTEYVSPAPFKYFYDIDGSLLKTGETLTQKWYVLDKAGVWRLSSELSEIIRAAPQGGQQTTKPVEAERKDEVEEPESKKDLTKDTSTILLWLLIGIMIIIIFRERENKKKQAMIKRKRDRPYEYGKRI